MEITLHDIEFGYDATPVLKGISARIESGAFVSLIGPNGSGKSTLLKCLNGILRVSRGEIRLDGRTINSLDPTEPARRMAYVPQAEQKIPPSTVFDSVLMGRKPWIRWKPDAKDVEITADVLKTLGLEQDAMKEVHILSGGQQQRVFIARALAQQPEVLLLDEPTANLDLKHQIEVLELLLSFTRRGITVIMAMHDINLVGMYGTRILMMKEGTLFAGGGKEVFTAEKLEELYGVKVQTVRDNGSVYILPRRHESKFQR